MKTRILPVLGILFAVTIIGRSVALSSEAIVDTKKPVQHAQTQPAETDHSKPAHTPVKAARTEAPIQQCATGEVLISVNKKLALLKTREDKLAARESAFKAINERLIQQLQTVESARDALASDIKKRTNLAEDDIAHLTTMYATMKPKQAAKIFDKMDPKFSAGFLREMKSGSAGLILANMESRKAYQISLVIASRNAKYREARTASLP